MASRVPLVFAGADYWDRTLPLIDGRIQPEGIELHWAVHYPGPLFGRMIRGEFEAGEMSASFLTMLISQGIDTLVGLPLFTSRAFRHAHAFVRADAGIDDPAKIKGKRVGVPDYPMTSAVWVRGFLKDDYGVEAGDIDWTQGGEDAAYNDRVPWDRPSHIKVTNAKAPIVDMLLEGELDAITGPSLPRTLANNPNIRPLIPDAEKTEKDYYARTGVFPMTHMVVMRRDVYERHPWMAVNLMQAFQKAKQMGWEQLRGHQSSNMLPWMPSYISSVANIFRGHPYKDGFEANLKPLEALTRYSYEQGLSRRKVNPAEIFAKETLKVVLD